MPHIPASVNGGIAVRAPVRTGRQAGGAVIKVMVADIDKVIMHGVHDFGDHGDLICVKVLMKKWLMSLQIQMLDIL